jgi:2-polyprenyl-3-methyl-5-hydroxy-6-metoxy-1,4-benzoquinol methylase
VNRFILENMAVPRPFYHRFAWAYDLLVNESIDARVNAIVSILNERGIAPGEQILDAGCGTGRYASHLASRGFDVLAIDSSAQMIEVARKHPTAAGATLQFSVAELTSLKRPERFSAILCRGVLNDLLTDDDRDKIACVFAELLAPGGVLLLDVRDWLRSVERYRNRTKTTRSLDFSDRTNLTFQSDTTLEAHTRQMIVTETFRHRAPDLTTIEQYNTEFRMRCWSESELHERFGSWLQDVNILPDYFTPPAWTDRLVLVATRKPAG